MQLIKHFKLHRSRAIKTYCLCFIYFIVGTSVAIIGPSLIDFQIAVNSTLEQVTSVPATRSGGYAIGSIISKYIYVLVHVHNCIIIINCYAKLIYTTFELLSSCWRSTPTKYSRHVVTLLTWGKDLGPSVPCYFDPLLLRSSVEEGGIQMLRELRSSVLLSAK